MKRTTLLFDPTGETQGNGNKTTDSSSVTEQVTAPVETTATSPEPYNPDFAPVEGDNKQTMDVDWAKEAKSESTIADFTKASKVVYAKETALEREAREAKEKVITDAQQNNQEGKQDGKETENQAQEGKATQVDDKGEGRREQQQVAQEDPLLKAFPEYAPFKKKMSKESVEFVNARLTELHNTRANLKEATDALAQGRSVVPLNYYENPNAYLLLPEFHQATHNVSVAQQIYNHWQQQRANILDGKEWYDVIDVKDAKGNLVGIKPDTSKKIPADGSSQAMVDEYWTTAREQLQQAMQSQGNIVQGFQQKVQQTFQGIRQAESDLFPPSKWENKESPEFKVVQQVKSSLANLGITPSNPAFSLLAKTGAQVLMLRDYIIAKEGKVNKQASIKDDARRAGPNGSATGSSGGSANNGNKNGEGEDLMEAFNKLKPRVHGFR